MGRPLRGDDALYERLTLEAFQSGLSWLTILRKRPAFRLAFDEFRIEKVAGYGEADVARLLADAGIVRNRAKVEAAIANARAALALPDGLSALLWSYAPPPRPARPRSFAEVPALTPESTALAKALKQRGFRFVGPTNRVRADAGHRHGGRPPRRLPRRPGPGRGVTPAASGGRARAGAGPA